MTDRPRITVLILCLPSLAISGCSYSPEASHQTEVAKSADPLPAKFLPGPDDGLPGKVISTVDLDIIEARLNIKLPSSYRTLMLSRGEELRRFSYPLDDKVRSHVGDFLFNFDPKHIVGQNEVWRKPDLGLAIDFPNWWEEYFLIGTNGGGDFYALKLDDDPTVWKLEHETGRIVKRDKTLKAYVDEFVDTFEEKSERHKKAQVYYSKFKNGEITRDEYQKLRSEAIYPRRN